MKAKRVADALFRSRIEITQLLRQLARNGALLTAELGDPGKLFLTRLLQVDPQGEFFIIAYSDERSANAALLQQPSVRFHASDQQGRIEFAAVAPSETQFAGAPAIRFAIPETLLRMQHREHPRFRVPADASLRCIADSEGAAPFEARIVDISRGGMGGMIYDAGVRLAPGSVLKECRIIMPGRDPVIADLVVRYTESVVQADGGLAQRAGVQFVGRPKGLQALLKRFVVELG